MGNIYATESKRKLQKYNRDNPCPDMISAVNSMLAEFWRNNASNVESSGNR